MNLEALASVKHDGVSLKISQVTGLDAFWYFVLPRSMFAARVVLKLARAKRYVDQFQLPDGSWWNKDGLRIEENK